MMAASETELTVEAPQVWRTKEVQLCLHPEARRFKNYESKVIRAEKLDQRFLMNYSSSLGGGQLGVTKELFNFYRLITIPHWNSRRRISRLLLSTVFFLVLFGTTLLTLADGSQKYGRQQEAEMIGRSQVLWRQPATVYKDVMLNVASERSPPRQDYALTNQPDEQRQIQVGENEAFIGQMSSGRAVNAFKSSQHEHNAIKRITGFDIRSLSSTAGQIKGGQGAQVDRLPQTRQISSPKMLQARLQRQTQKCALILQRTYLTKRTSQGDADYDGGDYDSTATSSSSLEPTGKQERICISFEEVNAAIAEAKRIRGFNGLSGEEINSIEPSRPAIAQLGELNQETSRILAQKFDMSNDEILNGLPLIDMSRTDFWPICPLMVKQIDCDPSGRFRSFTGHCNNLKNPTWGAAQTPFVRFLPPKHPDGIHMDRVSALDGSPLPSPRLITSMVHRDHDQPSGDLSLLVMVWGQIIDHDVALAAPPRDEQEMDFNCCKRQHPNCKPIRIPDNDPLYSRYGMKCMDFKRSLAGLRPNCALGPRVHINTITSTIDANTIYGSTKTVADQLRTFSGGQLKVQNVFKGSNLKPLLPKQVENPDLDCFDRPRGVNCFLAGDERVNEQPTLTMLHTLYVRDHNRMAKRLASINPHWDDDRIYHETRHIQAAIAQHILVNEFLPLLLGQEMMVVFNLSSSPPNTYWQGYDPAVTPSISQGFSTAAFRQGHTFIQGKVRLHDSRTHQFLGSESLRGLFKRPFHYYKPGRLDQVLAGVLNTPAQVYDPFITEEISGHLFQLTGEEVGMDLPAINLARGREQGTPGYNAYREWCGLPKAKSFEDLQPYMNNKTAFLYSKLYKHVDDIDLWSGGISERRMAGSQIGPTFACIIARQFANIKRGDRFWFENSGFPSSFTLDQLREIKRTTQARLICYNSDNMLTIQRNALKLPHPVYNPRVQCSEIPDLDLNYWHEDPSNLGSFLTSTGTDQGET